jgi:Na+/proline symporter
MWYNVAYEKQHFTQEEIAMVGYVTLSGLLLSALAYFFISSSIRIRSRHLADFLPMAANDSIADVKSAAEFNASTVATTISLATVILAFSELAPFLGLWLLWPVITTALGLLLVKAVTPSIWRKLGTQGQVRPTLHEFLGQSYNSPALVRIAAVCTSLGFLGALAIELSVGSEFLVALVPSIPLWAGVLLLAGIGIGYTVLGGFRAVVITDRVQMVAIWIAIGALAMLLAAATGWAGGASAAFERIPVGVYDFSPREGLVSFLLGIAVINIPAFLSDMSVWQRIAAANSQEIVETGLLRSALSAAASWGGLALIACALVAFTTADAGTMNPLTHFLAGLAGHASAGIAVLLLLAVLGLFAATLSTASTQLLAAGHAIYTDILHAETERMALANSGRHLAVSRYLLFVIAAVATLVVFVLKLVGFTISDLVFAVYGAQLGMVPVVIQALCGEARRTRSLRGTACLAVIVGFAAGWGSAAYGKYTGDSNLVFLAPVISLLASGLVLVLGKLASRA